jgi:DNA invertase Pin-like site-specific DNA recombinase
MSTLQPPIRPKNGSVVRVILVARVSDPGPGKQDIRSLDDQRLKLETFASANIESPIEFKVIAGSGSGENTERAEYLEVIELVASGLYDLVLVEDLGRIVRRMAAHLFAEHCAENDTRLIAINDHIDTGVPGWEDRSIFSAWHHEKSNRDTGDRIKRTHQSRFQSGGCAQFPIFGIIKPPGSKNDSEWRKDPECEAIYAMMAAMLSEHGNYSQVADCLNEKGIKPGPMCRTAEWCGAMVSRLIHNPLLKGWRYRNKRKSVRKRGGKYKTIPADPSETLWRHVPHLAFFDEYEWDRLIATLDENNSRYSRGRAAARESGSRGPRNRTRFPGQMVSCGICGSRYVFGGHGRKDHLMCDGSRQYTCWNGVTIDAATTTRKIIETVFEHLVVLPDFDEGFRTLVNAEAEKLDADRTERLQQLEKEIRQVELELRNFAAFIATGGDTETILESVKARECQKVRLRAERESLLREPNAQIEIPPIEDLKQLAQAELRNLPVDSWKFQQLMQKIIPKIVVHPFVPCDGGKAVCRAQFRLQIGNLLGDPRQRDALRRPLESTLNVDLFDSPQRIRYLFEVERLREEMSERAVARRLGISLPVAQKAAALGRLMKERGLTDPYLPVLNPESVLKLKRHRHPRYQFQSKPDAGVI